MWADMTSDPNYGPEPGGRLIGQQMQIKKLGTTPMGRLTLEHVELIPRNQGLFVAAFEMVSCLDDHIDWQVFPKVHLGIKHVLVERGRWVPRLSTSP